MWRTILVHMSFSQLIFGMLLKCADVSNEVRPFTICKRWALMLYDEFTTQVCHFCSRPLVDVGTRSCYALIGKLRVTSSEREAFR